MTPQSICKKNTDWRDRTFQVYIKQTRVSLLRNEASESPCNWLQPFQTLWDIILQKVQVAHAREGSILQAVSPRTLQTYVTAWKCFKSFHLSHSIPFPEFSLLSITSFIYFLNSIKCLQVSSIKGYISGIQFFHKLLYGAPSPNISNSQTALLIRGIQRTRPTRPDSRLPITLDILTKCIHTLRTGYQTPSTARTLDTMFILAFFGFLRCSELAISSKFDPATNPTISDLTILDSETISFSIKQSKTDQVKKGHFVYIFNLHSPLQSYQAVREYLRLRIFQARIPPRTLIFRPCRETSQSHLVPKNISKLSCYQQAYQQEIFPATLFASGQQRQRPKKASLNTRSKP